MGVQCLRTCTNCACVTGFKRESIHVNVVTSHVVCLVLHCFYRILIFLARSALVPPPLPCSMHVSGLTRDLTRESSATETTTVRNPVRAVQYWACQRILIAAMADHTPKI